MSIKISSFCTLPDLVYTPTNGVKYSIEDKEMYKVQREEIKELIYNNLAINIGNPGDMVTGKAFQKFSSDNSRALYVSLVEDDVKESFDMIQLGLNATVKVINSQKRRVNTLRGCKLIT